MVNTHQTHGQQSSDNMVTNRQQNMVNNPQQHMVKHRQTPWSNIIKQHHQPFLAWALREINHAQRMAHAIHCMTTPTTNQIQITCP
jgi:hypothetical protein